MIDELDTVVLTHDIEEYDLKQGDIGTAVQILQDKFHRLEQQEASQKLPMAEAAQLLLQDYLEDEELTVFTA